MELTCINNLVPQGHLLRLINENVDFSFITDKVRPFYSEHQGRPSIGPIRLFKMMLIGYLYGIRSERQLEQEIIPNAAYRWFLDMGFTDVVPDHSTISWNRNNRFKGTNVFQEIFDDVVRVAINHRMVAGRVLVTDSTHIRANANNNRFTMQVVQDTPLSYVEQLEIAVHTSREDHEKKPLPPRKEEVQTTKSMVSSTDPESGLLKRHGKPEGFHYLDHRTVDHKFNIITEVHVTPGNVNDSNVYIDRLKRQIDTFGFTTLEAVALDSGYMTPYICEQTQQMNIFAVIAERIAPSEPGIYPKQQFIYDKAKDVYRCPSGEELTYRTTNRVGYAEYQSDAVKCAICPSLNNCTTNKNNQRIIQRHVWEGSKEKVVQNRKSENGEKIYKMRKETIERSFADAKELHGYRRRCRMRGKAKVQEQALMTAIAQNIKKMARHLGRKAKCLLPNGDLLALSN